MERKRGGIFCAVKVMRKMYGYSKGQAEKETSVARGLTSSNRNPERKIEFGTFVEEHDRNEGSE